MNVREMLHRPDLMRMRGLLTLATKGDPSDAVSDLQQSLAMAIENGNAIYALRSARDLAELPDELRPADAQTLLAEALQQFGPDDSFEDLDDAREALEQP